jgi:hypothetical protein
VIDTSRGPSDADAGDSPDDARYYYADPSWFADNGLSFEEVVRGRMCDACRGKLGQEVEERTPVFDKGTGRMHFEVQKATYGGDPLKVIREHCGRAKNYIHRDMPTLEAIFRILLANGNQPMTLDQIREQLAEWCPGGGCQWLLLPQEMVERLVRNDRHY